MIIIDSTESLLSAALRNRLQEINPGIVFTASRNQRPGRNQDFRNYTYAGKQGDPLIQYFIIHEFPFNVYDIYGHLRSILRDAASQHAEEVMLHVVIKLNMNDLLMIKNVRSHCSYLSRMVTDLSRHLPYRVKMSFSCAYNLFGVVNASLMQIDSNNVQGLLFLLTNQVKDLVVPYAENEEIIGTDVRVAVAHLTEPNEGPVSGNDETSSPHLVCLPVNTPVRAGFLVNTVKRMQLAPYHSIRYSEKSGISEAQVNAELNPIKLSLTIADSFIDYL